MELEILNGWWRDRTVSGELAKEYHRESYDEAEKLMGLRQVLLISGLRRVGKSTIMYQLMEQLLKKGTDPNRVLYFSFDENVEEIAELLREYSDITGVDWKKERCYVFLDEIQKLKSWSNKLKLIYDSFPNLKFVISSSSNLALEQKAIAHLAGRYFMINVPPLSFKEYLGLTGSKIEIDRERVWLDDIVREFKNYLNRPYPEVVGFSELSLVKSYINEMVIDKIAKIDMPSEFGDVNASLVSRLLDLFYSNQGIYINYDSLSRDFGVGKGTLIKHIRYLELSYLIRIVRNFRPGMNASSRKMQRIYPYHWSLGFGWNGKINYETVAASLMDASYYWRDKNREVDFILLKGKAIVPVEVKESGSIRTDELKNLLYFIERYRAKKGVVVYNGAFESKTVEGKPISMLPFWRLSTMSIR